MYNDDEKGTQIGSLKRESTGVAETKEFSIEGDYKYIGIRSSSKPIYISSIEIVWEPSTEYQPEAPTINPSTQTFSKAFTATITAEDGADIYYTTDGSEPTTESTKYESGVEIPAATTTLKAIAVKDGATSEVSTAVYTYESLLKTPTISPASNNFGEAFTATITSNAAGVMYTLDGTDPSYENKNGELLTNAPFTVNIPAASTTLKVIAVDDDGNESEVATAVYAYAAPLEETSGTFENPLTPAQVIANKDALSGKSVWVEGKVLGSVQKPEPGYSTSWTGTSIVIGEACLYGSIGVVMPKDSYIRKTFENEKMVLGNTVKVYGTLGNYYNRLGFGTDVKFFAFPGETFSVNTEEGYSTYYCTSAPTLMPTGVKSGIVNVDGEVMTIDYKYEGNETLENGELVPASMPVLIKAEKKGTYPLIYSAKNKGTSYSNQNLVGQETTGTITAEDGYYYYKLAYDDYTTKTDLGFYWGAEDGGVFSVPAGKAYLKVAKTADVAVTAFRFDGTTVTGIGNVATDGAAQLVKSAYTIDGRRVDANRLTKGIYIVNGKKVVVK